MAQNAMRLTELKMYVTSCSALRSDSRLERAKKARRKQITDLLPLFMRLGYRIHTLFDSGSTAVRDVLTVIDSNKTEKRTADRKYRP